MEIFILTGKSAAGKDTLRKYLIQHGYIPYLSYTTRPIREGESEGDEYHFCSVKDFKKVEYIESRSYNTKVAGKPDTWYYGTPYISGVNNNGKYVMIKDPKGAKEIKNYFEEKVKEAAVHIIEVKTPQEERRRRAEGRGSFDETEWLRRVDADDNDFRGFEADLVLDGMHTVEEMAKGLKFFEEQNIPPTLELAYKLMTFPDDDFAEVFVFFDRLRRSGITSAGCADIATVDPILSVSDMDNFDEQALTAWLNDCLGEIVHSNDIDAYAWWKQQAENI